MEEGDSSQIKVHIGRQRAEILTNQGLGGVCFGGKETTVEKWK